MTEQKILRLVTNGQIKRLNMAGKLGFTVEEVSKTCAKIANMGISMKRLRRLGV